MGERSIATLKIDGGWLCLNFVNTVSDRTESNPFNYLGSYEELLQWSLRLGLLDKDDLPLLQKVSAVDKAKTWIKAIELREVLFRSFKAIIENNSPTASDQRVLNSWFGKAFKCLSLVYSAQGEVEQKFGNKDDISFPLYRIADSAYQLLSSDKLKRVKICSSCEWLFLDTTKNGSRRWCRMDTCGSQAKARSYYHRKKKETQ